jgi:hypothetical protein
MFWIDAAQYPSYPILPCLLLILASISIVLPLFYGRYLAVRLILAGLCAGGVVLFRYDVGLLTLIILSAAFVLFDNTGVTLLDDSLHEKYRAAATQGAYTILQR